MATTIRTPPWSTECQRTADPACYGRAVAGVLVTNRSGGAPVRVRAGRPPEIRLREVLITNQVVPAGISALGASR